MKSHLPTAPKTLAVLRALGRGRRLTIYYAMNHLRVGALSQEIGRLKRLGWKVADKWMTTEGGSRIKVYWKGWA